MLFLEPAYILGLYSLTIHSLLLFLVFESSHNAGESSVRVGHRVMCGGYSDKHYRVKLCGHT